MSQFVDLKRIRDRCRGTILGIPTVEHDVLRDVLRVTFDAVDIGRVLTLEYVGAYDDVRFCKQFSALRDAVIAERDSGCAKTFGDAPVVRTYPGSTLRRKAKVAQAMAGIAAGEHHGAGDHVPAGEWPDLKSECVPVDATEAFSRRAYEANIAKLARSPWRTVEVAFDPLDVETDGLQLRDALLMDELVRREEARPSPSGRRPRLLTPAQRDAVSAYWSAQLRAKLAASVRAERYQVVCDDQEEL